jgi:hypothetical protein
MTAAATPRMTNIEMMATIVPIFVLISSSSLEELDAEIYSNG